MKVERDYLKGEGPEEGGVLSLESNGEEYD
jgi:hypothetical protein